MLGILAKKLEIELTLKKYISYETQWGISKIYLFEDCTRQGCFTSGIQ